jgi:hypothetical protein
LEVVSNRASEADLGKTRRENRHAVKNRRSTTGKYTQTHLNLRKKRGQASSPLNQSGDNLMWKVLWDLRIKSTS